MVRGVGLEPTHLTIQEPKSCVSAISPAAHNKKDTEIYHNRRILQIQIQNQTGKNNFYRNPASSSESIKI